MDMLEFELKLIPFLFLSMDLTLHKSFATKLENVMRHRTKTFGTQLK